MWKVVLLLVCMAGSAIVFCDGCGGDPNSHPGCGVNCGRTCSTYKDKYAACILVCRVNGCDCNDGYVYDDNVGRCVLPDDCTPVCGLNEKFDFCINGGCGHRNCSQVGTPQICIDRTPESCIKGCVCSDGFLRAANGICIPQDQCPASSVPVCGFNEKFDSCINGGCGHRNCSQVGTPQICIDRTPESCIKGCVCSDGFLRAANGICIPRDQCPASSAPVCGLNEKFDSCINGGCGHRNCSQVGTPQICIDRTPESCIKGCVCSDGFLRAANGICIPRDQCPASSGCGGDINAHPGCGVNCGKTCRPNQPCPKICKVGGCDCNDGYVYDDKVGRCVLPDDCTTPACPKGEIYNRCPTVACEGDYCPKNRNSPQTCPVGIVCDPPRCTCGILDKRDRVTKKCIKAYTCPPFKCDGPNEHYEPCPAGCPGDACSDYVTGRKCLPFMVGIVVACRPACRCNKGYYRNSNNICVKAEQCGPVVTTTNTPVIIETLSTANPATGSSNSDAVASLKTGVTNFNGEFLYERLNAEPGKNLITSPYSVFTPLVQLALYTTGDSLKQLLTVLNASTKDQIRSGFPDLASSFEDQTSVNFSTAAKVYSDLKYPLSDGFKKDSVDVVHADAQELDFSKNTDAANAINSWVESQTNNRIRDLIKPSDLSELTRLVLVNAIYFKGEWLYAFNKTDTIKETDFYLSDGTTKKTNLMYQEGQFNYGAVPELNCTVLEMFYKGGNFSMVVVLPNEKDGLLQVAKNLQLKSNFDKVLGSLSRQKVKVYLPSFTIETTTDLSDILKKLGVTKIFDANDSGLSGLLKTPENTYVSKAIQKAFIEVNEEGSEAAAANGDIISTRAIPTPPAQSIVFRADRPILFYIRLQDTTIFCGVKSDI